MNKSYIVSVLFFVSIFLYGCTATQVVNVKKEKTAGLNAHKASALATNGESLAAGKNHTNPRASVEVTDNLSKIKIYPNPWQPNSAGKLGSATKSCGTGLIIDGLVSDVRVRIFSLQADLVWDKDARAASKCIAWNGRNFSGRDVASGIYTIIINDETGKNIKRNIAIER